MADVSPILVVGDHPDIRTEVSRNLNSAGFQAETVSSGSEAFERVSTTKYSLVISDEQISGIGRLDLLNSVKKISPQIPVIIMTANGSVHNAVEAMQAGAADYLLRPFSSESLEKTVKRIIGSVNGNGGSLSSAKKPDRPVAGKQIITQNQKILDILKQARGVDRKSVV